MDAPDPDDPETTARAMGPDDVYAIIAPHRAYVDSLSMARVRL